MNAWRRFLFFGLLGAGVLLVALYLFLTTAAEPALKSTAASRTPVAPDISAKPAPSHAAETPRPSTPSPAPTHPPGANAADFYKDAIALFHALTDEEKKALAHFDPKMDPEKAAALFAKIQPIMDLLRRAKSEATYADWGIGLLRFDSPMPHIMAAVSLGQVARWSAAYRFPTDAAGALNDLAAESQLGASMADQAMIGMMVSSSFTNSSINLIHDNLGSIPPELMPQVAQMFTASDISADLASGMKAESDSIQNSLKSLNDPAQQEKLARMLQGMPTGNGEKMTAAEIQAQLATLPEQAAWLTQVNQDFAQKALLPDAQFQQWWASVQDQAKARPFVSLVLPALNGVRSSLVNASVNRAMLSAGIAVMQSGPAAYATVIDPSTGRPFIYVPTANGFELHSPFLFRNKAVVRSFASPAAQ